MEFANDFQSVTLLALNNAARSYIYLYIASVHSLAAIRARFRQAVTHLNRCRYGSVRGWLKLPSFCGIDRWLEKLRRTAKSVYIADFSIPVDCHAQNNCPFNALSRCFVAISPWNGLGRFKVLADFACVLPGSGLLRTSARWCSGSQSRNGRGPAKERPHEWRRKAKRHTASPWKLYITSTRHDNPG